LPYDQQQEFFRLGSLDFPPVCHPSGQKEKGGNLNAIFPGRFSEKDLQYAIFLWV